jgi:hypothetical protein
MEKASVRGSGSVVPASAKPAGTTPATLLLRLLSGREEATT